MPEQAPENTSNIPIIKPLADLPPDSPTANVLRLFNEGRHAMAVEAARPLAEKGDVDALFLLGLASESGSGAMRSRDNALEFYKRAADQEHNEAKYRRALILLNTGTEEDRNTARKELEKAAQHDAATAGRILGEAWLRGLLSEKPDSDKAIEWWTKSSKAGDDSTLVLLARLYTGEFGFPEKKDDEKAFALYQQAATKGESTAYLPLASRLLNGPEHQQNENDARKWINKALENDQLLGYYILGDYQENVSKDLPAAIETFTKGAEKGQPDCMLRLVRIAYNNPTDKLDQEKGREWLEKAAEVGSPQAHMELAALLSQEEKPDTEKIRFHLVRSASGGMTTAQNELGMHYLSENLGGPDSVAAAAWFTRAAKAGDQRAQYNLATLYENGIGVDADINNAGELYMLAARQGHPQATTALARLHFLGIGTDPNPTRSWALATLAVERGDNEAKQILGELSSILTPELLGEAKKELESLKKGEPVEPNDPVEP